MLRVLPTATITARIMIIRSCLLLQHKTLTNTHKKRGEKHHQNLRHQFDGIFPPQKDWSEKVILL